MTKSALVDKSGASLGTGTTIPFDWYCDDAVFRDEQSQIFGSAWQYAGHLRMLPQPGSYFTTRAGQIPVVVCRTQNDDLKAHVNVCRHRGHEVASGEGIRKSLQCPYHAWTYSLDGALVAAPRAEHIPSFDKTRLCLQPLQLETWGPLIFVNPNVAAAPLAHTLAELPGIVALSGVDLTDYKFYKRVEYQVDANWKLLVDNDLECYHCPVAHPGLSDRIDVDPSVYQLVAHERFSSHYTRQRKPLVGEAAADERDDESQYQFHYIWPNLMISIVPMPRRLQTSLIVPLNASRSIKIRDFYFAEEVSEAVASEVVAFTNQTMAEDTALCESVQRGMQSMTVERGQLMLETEHLLQHFQQLVSSTLARGD